ncbi:ATP12 family protein [Sphingomicrobium sp. XHP0239]|uniref:ATP12 family chaperone protein n=1 Tax=Sphingomicrobium maritimum TaxID=3133972 RepID=UPI0031CC57CE
MKRFWTEAKVVAGDGAWGIELDGRTLKTPARADLRLPSEALAQAIAAEWNAAPQTDIDPREMPLTGLANAAIDRIAAQHDAFAADLAGFATNELLCYRAIHPDPLVERERAAWDPLLDWARERYDVSFEITQGVSPVDQPPATLERLAAAVAAEDAFALAGLSHLVRGGGSLIAALAVRHEAFSVETAWEAVEIDRLYQIEQWGADEEAEKAAAARREDFLAGARFLTLLSGSST